MRQWRLRSGPVTILSSQGALSRSKTILQPHTSAPKIILCDCWLVSLVENSTTSLATPRNVLYSHFPNELFSVKALTVRWRLQVYSKLLPFWQQLLQFKPLLLPQMLVWRRYVYLVDLHVDFPIWYPSKEHFAKIDSEKEWIYFCLNVFTGRWMHDIALPW